MALQGTPDVSFEISGMSLRIPLPTGTVTLLFTDIEGSTQRWERERQAMADAVRRHDALVRAAIEARRGHVFKTVGDAFCAAFSRPADALAAAADAQRALAKEDWSAVGGLHVRMALHSGVTEERDGDYFGPAVNRVARLLAIAHGGQVIVSGPTAVLLRGVMPEGTELRDLGQHQLKDLVEPERVWQVVAPDLPASFPPLRSLASLPNNLPRQLTPLLGRDDVLAEIEALAAENPLVTLVGTGGVGKTRLALQAGADALERFDDGVWLVELALITDAASVLSQIATVFGLHERGERPALDTLINYLKPRHVLLILDNCEHLIDEVSRVAHAVLHAAPHVHLIATSREPLRIAGERVYRVPSLSVPSDDVASAQEAQKFGAIALFVERAVASDAKFVLTDDIAPVVAEICRRLDGIALAIELAAARIRMLPPRQLAQKLDERFRVLTGGSRTALPRQQTMRALIDWSFDLLTEHEKTLFRRVAVFVGGWRLETAEAVCADDSLDALDIFDLLSSLVEKSLVVADAESSRYGLLESTRAFALEKLADSGERDALLRRHALWAAELGDRVYQTTLTLPTSQKRTEFSQDTENARAAADWALSNDEPALAIRTLSGFARARLITSSEARSKFEVLIDRLGADPQPPVAARAWRGLAYTSVGLRSVEAARRTTVFAEQSNDKLTVLDSVIQEAFSLMQSGRAHEAIAIIERALQLSGEYGTTRTSIHASMLNVLGSAIATTGGQTNDARQSYLQGLSLAESIDDDFSASTIRLNLAELEFQTGNAEAALELARALERPSAGSHTGSFHQIGALGNCTAYRIALGNIADARLTGRATLRLARGVDALMTTGAAQHLGAIAALSGDARTGAMLLGYVNAWYGEHGYEREPTEQRSYDILMTALREQLSQDEIESFAAEGARLSEEDAVNKAMLI